MLSYIKSFNSALYNFKQDIVKRLKVHIDKIKTETIQITNIIDNVIKQNIDKIAHLVTENSSVFEDLVKIKEFLDSDCKNGFLKQKHEFQVSQELALILEKEISNWNM